jgi:hypothetical protein
MALNLWKTAGFLNSYSNFQGASFNSSQLGLGDFVLTFKASSVLSGELNVFQPSEKDNFVPLTPTLTSYTVSFSNRLQGTMSILKSFRNSTDDVFITDVVLVRKSMPKLTINGIDGFSSGKWNLHANATIVNDNTLVLNATADGQNSFLDLDCLPNTTYTFSHEGTLQFNIWLKQKDGTPVTWTGQTVGTQTFTTPSNVGKMTVYLTNSALGTGVLTCKRPMLNMGSSLAPYEAKKGDRMVMPVVKKNMLPQSDYLFNGVVDSGLSGYLYPVKQGGTYTLSGYHTVYPDDAMSGNRTTIIFYYSDGTNDQILSPYMVADGVERFYSVTGIANPSKTLTGVRLWVTDYGSGSFMHRSARQVQLEVGPIATPFTPYAVQTNKLSKKYVPKKNYVPNTVDYWTLGVRNGGQAIAVTTNIITLNQKMSLKPNTNYVLNINQGYKIGLFLYDVTGATTGDSGWITSYPFQFTTNSSQVMFSFNAANLDGTNITVDEILKMGVQLEEGSTATSYEPYQAVIPSGKTGLLFDGKDDYISCGDTVLNLPLRVEATFTPLAFLDTGIISKWYGSDGTFLLGLTANGVQFVVKDTGTSNHLVGTTLNLGEKVNIVGEYDGATLKIYKNGVLMQSTNISITLEQSNGLAFEIGRHDGSKFSNVIMYKAKVTTNNDVIFDYDFTSPNAIVGNTLLNQDNSVSKNLLVGTSNPKLVPSTGTGTVTLNSEYSVSTTPTNWNCGFNVDVNLEAGKTYTLTATGTGFSLDVYNPGQTTYLLLNSGFTNGMSITPTYTGIHTIRFKNSIQTTAYAISNWQLEEGTTATLFRPYSYGPVVKGNLLPDFEDARWNLHANTQVLGKDTLRLNSTGVYQDSYIDLLSGGNLKYLVNYRGTDKGIYFVDEYDGNGVKTRNVISLYLNQSPLSFTTLSTTVRLRVILSNDIVISFDFNKPQLYQLDSFQGTVYGAPIKQLDSAKRILYAKR